VFANLPRENLQPTLSPPGPERYSDFATIPGYAENTVELQEARIFEKLGVENRNTASLKAIEV